MNLFRYVEAFGTAKGFVGKGFFSSEFYNLKCSVCKKVLPNNNRITCSNVCAIKHKIIAGRARRLNQYYGVSPDFKKLGRREFILLMQKKYRLEKWKR